MNDAPPDELIAALGLLGLCCIGLSLLGFVGLVVWLVRRQGQSTPTPSTRPAGVPAPAVAAAAPYHLSVLALSFDAFFRAQVQAAVAEGPGGPDSVAQRVALVQRLVHALGGLEARWQHFGYGEKDLADLAAAQHSYGAALEDFRARAATPALEGALCVVTLVLCTRGHRLGVDRLDTRAQIHELLADRLRVDAGTLLGAELVWDPPSAGLTEPALLARYPEMHRLAQ